MTRPSVKISAGEVWARLIDRMRTVDDYLLVEFTPASASDASAPNIKAAFDNNYIYVQISEGVWKRAQLSTW